MGVYVKRVVLVCSTELVQGLGLSPLFGTRIGFTRMGGVIFVCGVSADRTQTYADRGTDLSDNR